MCLSYTKASPTYVYVCVFVSMCVCLGGAYCSSPSQHKYEQVPLMVTNTWDQINWNQDGGLERQRISQNPYLSFSHASAWVQGNKGHKSIRERTSCYRKKWMKGSGVYRLPVMEWISHGDERYSIRNIFSDTVIALYSDRCSYTCGEQSITFGLWNY